MSEAKPKEYPIEKLDITWPTSLPIRLALDPEKTIESEQEIAQSFNLRPDQLNALRLNPRFIAEIASAANNEDITDDLFRSKCKAIAHIGLEEVHDIIIDEDVDPAVRLRAITNVTEWGYPQQKNDATVVPQIAIQINLGDH